VRTFAGVQALRGIAALSVVVAHIVSIRTDMGIESSIALGALAVLQSGVDVFFVISGFIITVTAVRAGAERGRWGAVDFAWSRVQRIYPIYWVVLAAAFVSSYWISVGPPVFSGDKLTTDVILLRTPANYFVSPAWTLYFEVSFYAAAAVAIALVPRQFFTAALTATLLFITSAVLRPDIDFGVFSHGLTLEFGFGVVIALLIQRANLGLTAPCLSVGLLLFATGGYLQINGHVSNTMRVLTFGLGAAFTIYAVIVAELRGTKFPKLLQWLGDMSYSLYICHYLIVVWLALNVVDWVPRPLQLVLWLAAVLSVSALVYRFIERPLSSRIRYMWRIESSIPATEVPQIA
jgi:peptidoglycan/LPS O-acetylase OafA/YrhL